LQLAMDSKTRTTTTTLRWMDPEDWGKFAWTVLFCLVPNTKADPDRIREWQSLMLDLPYVLPCITCRKCCQSYIATKPPPGVSSTFVNRVHWLLKLRRGIQERNVEKGNVSSELATAKGHFVHRHYPELEDEHYLVYNYRAIMGVCTLLWFNVYVFLICSAATMDPARQNIASKWFSKVLMIFREKEYEKKSTKTIEAKQEETIISAQQGTSLELIQRYSGLYHFPNPLMLHELFLSALPVHFSTS